MSDSAPEYLLAQSEESSSTSDSILEVSSLSTLDSTGCSETCGSPSSDDSQNSSNAQSASPSKTKVPTCAELLSVENNNKCFDCNTEGPLWVNVSYCIFLCAPCATIHAEFGLQVKPLSEHSLTVEDLALLGKTGNTVASAYWLATWDGECDAHLRKDASKDARTRFIIEKYRGKWLSPPERTWLAKQQHAFCAQPALYGPTYVSYAEHESLVAQAQQLSLNQNPNGESGSETNGTGYAQEGGYGREGGYADGAGYLYTNGYANGNECATEYANGYANGDMHGHAIGNANVQGNGYADEHMSEYTHGYSNEHAGGYGANTHGHMSGYYSEQANGQVSEQANAQANGQTSEQASETVHGNVSEHPNDLASYVFTNGHSNGYATGHANGQANGYAHPLAYAYANAYANHARQVGYTSMHANSYANAQANNYANGNANVYANGQVKALASVLAQVHAAKMGMINMPTNGGAKGSIPKAKGAAPDFVMNSTITYTKKGRRGKQAH